MDNDVLRFSTLDDGYDYFINDRWRKKYHFRIFTFPVPSGILSEAVEVIDESSKRVPMRYSVLSDFDADTEQAELTLKAKIKKSINQRHLKRGKPEISDEGVIRGTLGYTGFSDTAFNMQFEIDGRRITVEQFIEMLDVYQGFNFKLKIYDPTDDMD